MIGLRPEGPEYFVPHPRRLRVHSTAAPRPYGRGSWIAALFEPRRANGSDATCD